jgi:hypothetical protein
MAVSVPQMAAVPPLCSRCRNLCKAPREVRRGAALAMLPVGSAKFGPGKRLVAERFFLYYYQNNITNSRFISSGSNA